MNANIGGEKECWLRGNSHHSPSPKLLIYIHISLFYKATRVCDAPWWKITKANLTIRKCCRGYQQTKSKKTWWGVLYNKLTAIISVYNTLIFDTLFSPLTILFYSIRKIVENFNHGPLSTLPTAKDIVLLNKHMLIMYIESHSNETKHIALEKSSLAVNNTKKSTMK